jgi:hypothetical protein
VSNEIPEIERFPFLDGIPGGTGLDGIPDLRADIETAGADGGTQDDPEARGINPGSLLHSFKTHPDNSRNSPPPSGMESPDTPSIQGSHQNGETIGCPNPHFHSCLVGQESIGLGGFFSRSVPRHGHNPCSVNLSIG